MARQTRVIRGRSGAVHNKEWTVACIDGTSLDHAIGSVVAFSMFTADEAETVLRTRGFVHGLMDPTAVNEHVTIAIGLAIVSARSVSVGVTAIPRPATEGSYPWLWHGWMQLTSGQEGAIVNDFLAERVDIDSKAMRKIKETEVMLLAFEVCESSDQAGITLVHGGLRVLTGD